MLVSHEIVDKSRNQAASKTFSFVSLVLLPLDSVTRVTVY